MLWKHCEWANVRRYTYIFGKFEIKRPDASDDTPFQFWSRNEIFLYNREMKNVKNNVRLKYGKILFESIHTYIIIWYCSSQRFFATRRSLSESDCERYHRVKLCRCKYVKEEESLDERMQFLAFPSFNDIRLQIIGLSCSKDIDNVYRYNSNNIIFFEFIITYEFSIISINLFFFSVPCFRENLPEKELEVNKLSNI